MKVNYNVTGNDRKRLVIAIAEITGASAVYKGAPTFAYEVDYFTIDKAGVLSFDDCADSEEIENLLEQLADRGFVANYEEQMPDALTVAVPFEKVSVENLKSLLEAKGNLIQKALGIADTQISIEGDRVSFPWFSSELDADTISAYTKFISALCEMSINQKRITAKPKENENEKYAFRCFLLRLGFIGDEFKADRKILLKNLDGSSAFKSGAKKEDADNEISE